MYSIHVVYARNLYISRIRKVNTKSICGRRLWCDFFSLNPLLISKSVPDKKIRAPALSVYPSLYFSLHRSNLRFANGRTILVEVIVFHYTDWFGSRCKIISFFLNWNPRVHFELKTQLTGALKKRRKKKENCFSQTQWSRKEKPLKVHR